LLRSRAGVVWERPPGEEREEGGEGRERAVGKISGIFFPRGGRHVSGDGAGIGPSREMMVVDETKAGGRGDVAWGGVAWPGLPSPPLPQTTAAAPRYFPLLSLPFARAVEI